MHNTPFQIALTQYGIKETVGKEDNPEVIKYFDLLGFGHLKDETAWCSAFVNWCCFMAGLPYTKKLFAVSWLKWGTPVDVPKVGDVAIFWRGAFNGETIGNTNIKKGHVGFYVREDDRHIWVLGGNQGNRVQISAYPKSKLIGYRRENNQT